MGTDCSPWNMNELIDTDFFILGIIASSGKGKTTLIKFLIKQFVSVFDIIFVFSGSEPSIDNSYIDSVYPSCIHVIDDVSNKIKTDSLKETLKAYVKFSTTCNTKINNDNKINNTTNKEIRTLFIFDDFSSNMKCIDDLVSQCRHANISIAMLVHREIHLSTSLRAGTTHIFSHVTTTLTNKSIDNNMVTPYMNYCEDFKKNNKDRTFFFYNKTDPTNLKWLELTEDDKKKDSTTNLKFYSTQRESIRQGLSDLANSIEISSDKQI